MSARKEVQAGCSFRVFSGLSMARARRGLDATSEPLGLIHRREPGDPKCLGFLGWDSKL